MPIVSQDKRPRKRKSPTKGITVPFITDPDTGIAPLDQVTAVRYRIWYIEDGKRKYVMLPKGTTIEDARTRRDTLYRNLILDYGARRKPVPVSTRKPRELDLSSRKLIRFIPAKYEIHFRGKYIGCGKTREIAEAKLAKWIEDNSAEGVKL